MEFVWICVLVVVVSVWAAIGHGIWMLVAAILGGLFGARTETKPHMKRWFRRCPSCNADAAAEDDVCVRCGLALDSGLARKLSWVRAAETEIRRLEESGDLDADTARTVRQQLHKRAESLRGIPAAPSRIAEPVPSVAASVPAPAAAPERKPRRERAAEPEREPRPEPVHVPVRKSADEPAAAPRREAPTAPPPASPDLIASEGRSSAAPSRHGSFVAAFMEERNILWGELVGGLLIVGCSIALVVTLWRSLESIPYFPFLLSTFITLALYGAGQYTLHHWRLTATSRGLLVIALLLTPLNLLLLSDDITRGEASVLLDAIVKLGAIALFAWVVHGGGRDLLIDREGWRWLLALALAGPAAMQLIPASGHVDSRIDWPAWMALACFLSGSGLVLRDRRALGTSAEPAALGRSTGIALLVFMGLAAFGLTAALGLHIARSPDLAEVIAALALPLALAAAPVVEVGLVVQQRTRFGGLRAAGTAVALAGFLALTSAVAAAWPDPLRVLLVCAAAGLFLTRIAFRESLGWAHAGAIPAQALAVVTACHGLAGDWRTSGDGLVSVFFPAAPAGGRTLDPQGGVVLAAFGLLLAGIGELLAARRVHAVSYALGGAACGVAGLFLVSVNGLEYPWRAAAVSGACAAGLLAFNTRWKLRVCAHGGLWLVLLGSIWVLHAAIPSAFARWGFVLALEACVLATLSLVLIRVREGASALVRGGARDVSIAAAILAGAFALLAVRDATSPWHTATLFALAATALLLTRLLRSPIPTYLGAAFALLGFLHLTTLAIGSRPVSRALLLGLLAHASITIALAYGFRRRLRLYGFPLWRCSLVTTSLAALPLLSAPAEYSLQWAGFAAWLGLAWLAYALFWREAAAFAAFQLAWSAAAVFCGVAWVEARVWQSPSVFAFVDPASLQAYVVALGLLSVAWAIARRFLPSTSILRRIWLDKVWSTDRIVLAALVLFQVFLAAATVAPEVKVELTPRDGAGLRQIHELPRAFGASAWLALGVLVVAVATSWRLSAVETGRTAKRSWPDTRELAADAHIIGLLLLFLTAPMIWAGTFAADHASASALRWGLGAAFAAGSGVMIARTPLRRWLGGLGFPIVPSQTLRIIVLTLLAIACGVVLWLSIQVAEMVLTGQKLSGPLPESLFAAMGALASNLVPLALVVVGLAGTSVRERSPGYAFAGGLVFASTLAAGYALGVVTAGGRVDGPEQMRVWLLACGAAAVWALAWLSAEARVPGGHLLVLQTRLGLAGLCCIAAAALVELLIHPSIQLNAAWAVFGRSGWLALALAAAAAYWQALRHEPITRFSTRSLIAALAGVVAACTVQPWDDAGRWLSFHVLAGVWVAVVVGLMVAVQRGGVVSGWLTGFAIALAILALRSGWTDPARPWAPAVLALVASVAAGTAGYFGRSPGQVYLSLAFACLSPTLLWLPSESDTVAGFLLANAAGLSAASTVWSFLAIRNPASRTPAVDLAQGVVLATLGLGLFPTWCGDHASPLLLNWSATALAAMALSVVFWDARAMLARGGLFAVGVAAVLLGVAEITQAPVGSNWQTHVALATYAFAVAGMALAVSQARAGLLRLPVRGDSWIWLLIAQGVVGAFVLMLGIRTGLVTPGLLERLSSSGSALLLAATALVLVRATPAWAASLRYATVGLGAFAAAAAAWAAPDPAGVAPWLERNAWLFVALTGAGVLATETRSRLPSNWRSPFRDVGATCLAIALATLVVNQIQQTPLFDAATRRTPLGFAAVVAMAASLVVLIVVSIRFALSRNRNPFALSENRRTAYVYLAELLIVSLFVHIRFNVPELFLGTMVRYWTFAVMALAFVGIGLAEYFERRSIPVLAAPLRRTGVLLPLIPLLAFWLKPPAALAAFAEAQAPGLSPFLAYLEKLPQHFDTYAWLWTLAGLVYGLVALARNSFGWALVAALATNAALWSLLTHQGVPFLVHPQAWVIPFALIVLVSEHVNRRRLRAEASNGLRYLGVSMIYIASTADMFIAGVGNSVWLPVILAMICVAGVLAGIQLRVRAFLYLGVSFLALDVFAMIWHAAVDLEQTWVWYVSGIVLGVAILTLFAVFEKRKKSQTEG